MNEGDFKRRLADTVRKDEGLREHPEDFFAVFQGTMDDSTGEIIGNENGPEKVCEVAEFVEVK